MLGKLWGFLRGFYVGILRRANLVEIPSNSYDLIYMIRRLEWVGGAEVIRVDDMELLSKIPYKMWTIRIYSHVDLEGYRKDYIKVGDYNQVRSIDEIEDQAIISLQKRYFGGCE